MKYTKVVEGIFIERPNRFIAKVQVAGEVVIAHVKNTGRCKELLVPLARVYLEDHIEKMGTRKLRYSLITVEKEGILINMDSQAPNKVVEEAIKGNTIKLEGLGVLELIKREKTYKKSRFDFYLEDNKGQEAFVEVKGVTLEENGIVLFPDAPTERGIKHLRELMDARAEGYLAFAIFLIQMKDVKLFTPNYQTHREFGETLVEAREKGVGIRAFDSVVKKDEIVAGVPVKVVLEEGLQISKS